MKKHAAYYILIVILLVALSGCATGRPKPPRGSSPERVQMTITAYCDCQQCTGWRRNWRMRPVIASGSSKGQRKKVGITASGTRARPGTIAADTRLYPFGTIMYVPGYGYGRVEDRGSAIQGQIIDVFYKRHKDALQWGRQRQEVLVWRP